MNTWRLQRQITIFGIYFLLAIAPFAIIIYLNLASSDTCFDGIKNQNEEGVDCNGVCTLQCRGSYKPIKINFVKGLYADQDNYNVAALIENPNANVAFPSVPYNVVAYNKEAQLLVSASGTTSIMPNSRALVYLPNLKMKQFPSIVDINLGIYDGVRDEDRKFTESVTSGAWSYKRGASNSLQLATKIKNSSINKFYSFEVYAILYDDTKSVYATGKTVINEIAGRSDTAAIFTWGDIKDPANVDFIITQNILAK
jgi:hypothetical protein